MVVRTESHGKRKDCNQNPCKEPRNQGRGFISSLYGAVEFSGYFQTGMDIQALYVQTRISGQN